MLGRAGFGFGRQMGRRVAPVVSFRANGDSVAEKNVSLKSRIPVARGLSCIRSYDEKREVVLQLLTMKDASGLSFDTIAQKLG